ncbi:MAG: SLC13 family permease [Cohaesibacteraceae bacterium]|nr:SLC13 family permease [Cohaesibacteraceae bacterium]
MGSGIDIHMMLTMVIIIVTICAYAAERVSIEVISIASLCAFLVLFTAFPYTTSSGDQITPEQLLSGFANPALITVLSLLIVGQALFQTDALERPATILAKMGKKSGWIAFVGVYLIAALFSAFINNTPVVVMLLPIVVAIAAGQRLSTSKVLMPLSFITILGGMTTLIGSSTNLLVASSALKFSGLELGFFDLTGIGSMMFAIGAVYALFIMPRLLKPRQSMADEIKGGTGKQFIAQIPITYDHPLVGTEAVSGLFPAFKDMTVRLIQRGEHPFLPPFENLSLQPGDVVIVAATRQALTKALAGGKAGIPASEDDDTENNIPPPDFTLAEAIVPPGSRLISRTVEQAGFRSETGCVVLGIQRRNRMPRMAMNHIRLEAGDVLLVGAPRASIEGLRANRDLLLVEFSTADVPHRPFAPRALVIFASTVIAAATGVVPIVTAALGGAFLMIASNCLNLRQAGRAFDGRIMLLIGASLASAVALEKTGGAELIAGAVVDAMAGQSVAFLLSGLFLLIAVMTNILSNNATAVLFTPIALSIAAQTGQDPVPFVVCVIIAANCSFATPIGYQTNLLIMGPGHYRFSDFFIAGIPLVILIWLSFSIIAPWYYGLV